MKRKNGGYQAIGEAEAARRTEVAVSSVLRIGVALSAAVILFGLALLVLRGGLDPSAGIDAPRAFPHTLGDVIAGVAGLEPLAVISLGLLLMILTPVTRVATSILAFAAERDWRYVAISALVLAVLIAGFLLGRTVE